MGLIVTMQHVVLAVRIVHQDLHAQPVHLATLLAELVVRVSCQINFFIIHLFCLIKSII